MFRHQAGCQGIVRTPTDTAQYRIDPLQLFGDDLLLLDLVNAVTVDDATTVKEKPVDGSATAKTKPVGKDKTAEEQLEQAQPEIRSLYEAISSQLLALGDHVQQKQLKQYIAFRRLKNFACVVPYKDKLLVLLKLNPDTVTLETGFSRDVRNIGKWGTGDVELCLRNPNDLQRALPLLERSYGES